MNSQETRYTWLTLLLAAHLLAQPLLVVVALFLPIDGMAIWKMIDILASSIAGVQITLLAVWLGMGPGSVWRRGAMYVFGSAYIFCVIVWSLYVLDARLPAEILAVISHRENFAGRFRNYAILFNVEMLPIAALLMAGRPLVGRITTLKQPAADAKFDLSHLLGFVTLLALIFGLFRYLEASRFMAIVDPATLTAEEGQLLEWKYKMVVSSRTLAEIIIARWLLTGGLAIIAFAWRRWYFGVAPAIAGFVWYHALRTPHNWQTTVAIPFDLACIFGSLWVLREAGFRLETPWRRADEPDNPQDDT